MPVNQKSRTTEYRNGVISRYWRYQKEKFADVEAYFEQANTSKGRPPVFLRHLAHHNVIVKPHVTEAEKNHLFNILPAATRHKWFGSMNSSQALAQSVLGNLAVHNHLDCLAEIMAEGLPLLGPAQVTLHAFSMEHKVTYLGEPQSSRIDAFISGPYQVAIECKFTEQEVGACSRPRLDKSASNYATHYCNGSYTFQRGRQERCSLSETGALYWKYIPALFKWDALSDLAACPLHANYQLVRNILAACVRTDGTASPQSGHAILIYDERNPAFQRGGNGWRSFTETQEALIDPTRLRKCSWQTLIKHLKSRNNLSWLTERLDQKYGLH